MAIRTRIFSFVFVMMMSFTVLLSSCSARVYKVGDSEGWTAKDDVYYAWAETDHKEFQVGDSLVFKYDPIINDVTHVSGSLEYEFCDYSSPKAVYNTGHDVVTLTEPGFHYFITSNQGQCVLGQKLEVLVIHDLSSPVPPPTPPSKILPVGNTYKVGDSKGWTVYDSDFYSKWSEEKQFHVGDSLIFEYANEINDVYEINGDLEFITCDPTSPVDVHKTGHDLVRLTEPGVHYFITSQSGYCEAGLKLRVMVGPKPKAVTYPNFPKKVVLSAMERLNNWLNTFKHQPHH
ncbi:hypothetical protein Bca4012_095845 [Brassica carinata]|uniref:Phytocyanin domain-containing protein n=3 Tax=Brassica TaxID=3705 RepID=A0A0D3DUV8_BRAOL|nr:PREDICTED: early nodulin-55-2-like [Brassica oleracea var. oleracea]XP_048620842.1 early nodulin-55-2-like [Brassica napus]KAG2260853.1 hypothetical protein Bca52824_080147 [Brassica carinata]CAF2113447.1 unnamed protein product [Brassica napus]